MLHQLVYKQPIRVCRFSGSSAYIQVKNPYIAVIKGVVISKINSLTNCFPSSPDESSGSIPGKSGAKGRTLRSKRLKT